MIWREHRLAEYPMQAAAPLLILFVSWALDMNDPFVQQSVITVYGLIHVALLLVAGYLFYVVAIAKRTDGDRMITVPVKDYAQPDVAKTENITVATYDKRKLRELVVSKILVPLCITGFIYRQWGTVLPLLFQTINNPMVMYKFELFQLFVLGRPEKFELARPWEEPDPMPSWLKGLASPSAEDDKTKKKKK